jgi:hypothetical protein
MRSMPTACATPLALELRAMQGAFVSKLIY